jgi:magnesium-transporting ATPase (P-type)
VFARVLPEQKLRLVQAYKDLGHIVAVTGDGVNDAPALRAANIGIAMGKSGTDVAREAADIVLIDDNFATIVGAIEQGRAVYQNIRKFMTYILASNMAEFLPFLAMGLLKIPPALAILQILAIDLGTDMLPALALGAEKPEAGIMQQPPRKKSKPLLDRSLMLRAYCFLGLIEGLVGMTGFFLVLWTHGYRIAELQAVSPAILSHSAIAAWANFTSLGEPAKLTLTVGEQGILENFKFDRWGNPEGKEFHYVDFGGIVEQSHTFDGYMIPTRIRAGWYFGSERFESDGEFFRCTIDKAIYR